MLRYCGQYNRALELLDEARVLLPDDRRDLEARILWNEGGIHSVLQHGEIAEENVQEALQLYRELDDFDGEIQALGVWLICAMCLVGTKKRLHICVREIEKRLC